MRDAQLQADRDLAIYIDFQYSYGHTGERMDWVYSRTAKRYFLAERTTRRIVRSFIMLNHVSTVTDLFGPPIRVQKLAEGFYLYEKRIPTQTRFILFGGVIIWRSDKAKEPMQEWLDRQLAEVKIRIQLPVKK